MVSASIQFLILLIKPVYIQMLVVRAKHFTLTVTERHAWRGVRDDVAATYAQFSAVILPMGS
jgi:hypothetical protein